MHALKDGLVTLDAYDDLIKGDDFKRVEKYSNKFISKVGSQIQSYNFRWVADPLHQWSRQWEYLYIISQAEKLHKKSKVLDLGAGISFLPFYLKDNLGFKSVVAVDYDKSLSRLYGRVNDSLSTKVDFMHGDMRNLSHISEESQDFIYSVSVLEHTNNYTEIIKEIYRILKPGGVFSFTFDISIDGKDDIPVKEAKKLISAAKKTFKGSNAIGLNLDKDLLHMGLVTSRVMAHKDKSLMPWKYPVINVLRPLLEKGKPGTMYKNLTFCCITLIKEKK